MLRILIVLVAVMGFTVPYTYAICYYGTSNNLYGDGIYGGDCPVGVGQQPGGGGGQVNIPYNLHVPFGYDLVNGSCLQKQQLFNSKCYDCNPDTSYVDFNPSDRSILCYTCKEDYIPLNGHCAEVQKFNFALTFEDMALITVGIGFILFMYLEKKKAKKQSGEEEYED